MSRKNILTGRLVCGRVAIKRFKDCTIISQEEKWVSWGWRGKEIFRIWHSITFELKAAPRLTVALESLIFVAACGIFSCSMQTLR